MSKRTVYIIILWIVLHTSAHLSAQDISNRRFGTIRLDSTSVVLDSLSIMPGSLSLSGLDTADYTIDYPTATLHLKNPAKVGSTVTYTYRSMLRDLSRPVSHKSPDLFHLQRHLRGQQPELRAQLAPQLATRRHDCTRRGNPCQHHR